MPFNVNCMFIWSFNSARISLPYGLQFIGISKFSVLPVKKYGELTVILPILFLRFARLHLKQLTFGRPRSQNPQYNHFTSIPYKQAKSEKVRGILNEAGVKAAMKSIHTIGRIPFFPRDLFSPQK